MSANPLAGLRVPSVEELADEAISLLGTGTVDLSNHLWRQRLRNVLQRVIGNAMMNVEAALLSSQEKSVRHVFRLMEDPNYQENRAKRLKAGKERRAQREEERRKQLETERAAHQRKKLEVVEVPKGVIQ
jgi:hypothetical protein